MNASTRRPCPTVFLFCPGNRPDRFEKALNSGSPGIVLDLEDAVPHAEKEQARRHALVWLAQQTQRPCGTQLAVRINEPDSAAGLEDVYAIAHAPALPDDLVVVLPKTKNATELRGVASHLLRGQSAWRLLALVETVEGLENAADIACGHDSLVGVGFGAADLAAQLGVANAWLPLLYARSRLVMAAARSGVALLDVPHLDLHDTVGLRDTCRRALELGFHGKFAIHPAQVAAILDEFTPDAPSIARAERVVAAFEAAEGRACVADGRMIDQPVYRLAQRTLARVHSR